MLLDNDIKILFCIIRSGSYKLSENNIFRKMRNVNDSKDTIVAELDR